VTEFEIQERALSSVASYVRSGQLSITALADGTGVVLDVETMSAYALNCTGMLLLSRILSGTESIQELSEVLTDTYKVTPGEAHQDVGEFLSLFLDLLPTGPKPRAGKTKASKPLPSLGG